ncbi:DUF1566 domain-containing protein [Rhabdochromatium marinum]|uniref:Lcl C-terminal domain-containing protein n=1 Tax=Rhabdochromatium marinum TaxID=48729 RepID=UPI00190650C2|nr:DUF1566 domain-containing protein [Rhabdochromatium marinum]MBK1647657.1 hypothetical protein [Rhabdochromatium marinum]
MATSLPTAALFAQEADPGLQSSWLDQYDLNWDGRVDEREISAFLTRTYPIVDTGQVQCFDDNSTIGCPGSDSPWFGQDAQYFGNEPRYLDNGDGTVTDLITGLMWSQNPGAKKTFAEAIAGAATFNLAGYDDWRLPTIKELYSLILFSGRDVSICMEDASCAGIPFIDAETFAFQYGDTSIGERIIDAQYWSATQYISTTMNGAATAFGVNFADGRIKGYPEAMGDGSAKTEFTLYVRGNPNYGINAFSDNGDGTVSDEATGLLWAQADSGVAFDWPSALSYCETLSLAGRDDWRLPNAKELHSLVDYTQAPAVTATPAIDTIFQVTPITNEGGQLDYPWYWTSTTHANIDGNGSFAAYIAFGETLGYMSFGSSGITELMDVHGAGAQRSSPKTGDEADWAGGHGPQGDVIRINNFARCVAGGVAPDILIDPSADPTLPTDQPLPPTEQPQPPVGPMNPPLFGGPNNAGQPPARR